MIRLPPEVITRIFDFIRESESIDGLDYEFTDAYHRFFDNASLVSKAFSALAKPFRQCYTIPRNTEELPLETWNGGYARNGERLIHSMPVKALHIDEMGCHLDDPYYVLALPNRFRSLLVGAEYTISSISLHIELLQLDIPRNCLGTDAVLQRILNRVKRLHAYADQYCNTTYSIESEHPNTLISGCELPWRFLADSVWGPGRVAPLKELSLSMVTLNGSFEDEKGDAITCPAETVILADIWLENSLTWSEYFPAARRLVLKQTEKWRWAYLVTSMSKPKSLSSYNNLILDASSKSLRHFEACWRYMPSDIRTCSYLSLNEPSDPEAEVHFPLRRNADILKSPLLETILLKASSHVDTSRRPVSTAVVMQSADLTDFRAPTLLDLSMTGMDLMLQREDVIKLCTNFIDPEYMPTLRRFPKFALVETTPMEVWSSEEKAQIRKGYQALVKRGLTAGTGELKGTLWELAMES